jgi:hypothetical protein
VLYEMNRPEGTCVAPADTGADRARKGGGEGGASAGCFGLLRRAAQPGEATGTGGFAAVAAQKSSAWVRMDRARLHRVAVRCCDRAWSA